MKTNGIAVAVACCLMCLIAAPAFGQENLALNKVVIKTADDIPVIRGNPWPGHERVNADPLDITGRTINPHRRALEIVRVGNTPGGSDYEPGKDFVMFNSWMIQWLLDGKQPRQGATYFVSCKYVASEKGHQGGSHGGYLTDGTRSAWGSRAPGWIYVDLGEEKTIGRAVVRQESGTNYISEKIVLQFAKPGAVDLEKDAPWENVVSIDDKLKNPLENVAQPVIDFKIQPVKSRYFRLVVEKGCLSNTNFAYISELELYAP